MKVQYELLAKQLCSARERYIELKGTIDPRCDELARTVDRMIILETQATEHLAVVKATAEAAFPNLLFHYETTLIELEKQRRLSINTRNPPEPQISVSRLKKRARLLRHH